MLPKDLQISTTRQMAARPNYRQTTVAPVAPEHDVPGAMNIEANPPPPQSFWKNDFVRLIILMLVVAAGYAIVRLGFFIAEKTRHHHHTFCTRTVVVSLDGTGEYTTVSGALQNAPDMSTAKYCVLIKPGRYAENVVVEATKTNIVLIGQGTEKTILIAENDTTLEVLGERFMALNMTIENPGQALNLSSDLAIILGCNIMGNYSTLHAHTGRQFYKDCKILGADSVINGDAAAYFKGCNISVGQNSLSNSAVVTSHGGAVSWSVTGFVFDQCRIESAPVVKSAAIYLGCPRGNNSKTIVMSSFITGAINPSGWTICRGYPPYIYLFGEYNNSGPGANTRHRGKWKGFRVLTDSEAASFTVQPFFGNIDWLLNSGVPNLL